MARYKKLKRTVRDLQARVRWLESMVEFNDLQIPTVADIVKGIEMQESPFMAFTKKHDTEPPKE